MGLEQIRDGRPLSMHLAKMSDPASWSVMRTAGRQIMLVLPLKRCHHPGAEVEHACTDMHDEAYMQVRYEDRNELKPVVYLGNMYAPEPGGDVSYPSFEAILEDGWGVD